MHVAANINDIKKKTWCLSITIGLQIEASGRGCFLKIVEETIQYNTIQYNTIQYNTIQYNTIQYNTKQYNTIQYNAIQYNIKMAKQHFGAAPARTSLLDHQKVTSTRS
jgi:hypothetical protein